MSDKKISLSEMKEVLALVIACGTIIASIVGVGIAWSRVDSKITDIQKEQENIKLVQTSANKNIEGVRKDVGDLAKSVSRIEGALETRGVISQGKSDTRLSRSYSPTPTPTQLSAIPASSFNNYSPTVAGSSATPQNQPEQPQPVPTFTPFPIPVPTPALCALGFCLEGR